MIRARLIGNYRVALSGLPEDVRKRDLDKALTRYGRALQDRIAQSFANEKVAGTSSLGANTKAYNAAKARQGYDPRRGHRTNNLQRVLDGTQLFVVLLDDGGKADVTFSESLLHSAVPYSEYYEDAKVRQDGILVLAKSWVQAELPAIQRSLGTAKRAKPKKVRREAPKRIRSDARFKGRAQVTRETQAQLTPEQVEELQKRANILAGASKRAVARFTKAAKKIEQGTDWSKLFG